MNRRQLLVSSLAATAAGALGLKATTAASAAESVTFITRYGPVTMSESSVTITWGPPGIGKSAIMQAAAEERGETIIDLALVDLDTPLAFPDHPMIPTKPLTFSARDLITEVIP